EAGLLPQHSNGISKVLQEILDPACAAGISAVLFHLLRTTECKPRLSPRFVRRVALCDQLVRVLFKMESQFLVELFFHFLSAQETLPPIHSAPPRTISVPDRRRQSIAASLRLPFRVASALSSSGDRTLPRARSPYPPNPRRGARGSRAGARPGRANLAELGPRRAKPVPGAARWRTR